MLKYRRFHILAFFVGLIILAGLSYWPYSASVGYVARLDGIQGEVADLTLAGRLGLSLVGLCVSLFLSFSVAFFNAGFIVISFLDHIFN